MKAWNRWTVFWAGLLCATGALAASAKPIPIEDRDAFEKQFIECILAGSLDGCIVPLFLGHASPLLAGSEKGAEQLNAALQRVAKEVGWRKVHSFSKTMKAGIFDERVYLVEAKNGKLGCFHVVFMKQLGKWYVGAYEISSEREDIAKTLGLPLPGDLL
ncbi:MAG: hypothetical protein LBF61_00310 [Azoarcus sp.]|jgi:hypothetical protein|nr:hypothetical protein [Azoarcus sp.]